MLRRTAPTSARSGEGELHHLREPSRARAAVLRTQPRRSWASFGVGVGRRCEDPALLRWSRHPSPRRRLRVRRPRLPGRIWPPATRSGRGHPAAAPTWPDLAARRRIVVASILRSVRSPFISPVTQSASADPSPSLTSPPLSSPAGREAASTQRRHGAGSGGGAERAQGGGGEQSPLQEGSWGGDGLGVAGGSAPPLHGGGQRTAGGPPPPLCGGGRRAAGDRHFLSASAGSEQQEGFFLFWDRFNTAGCGTGGDGPPYHCRVKSNAPQNRR